MLKRVRFTLLCVVFAGSYAASRVKSRWFGRPGIMGAARRGRERARSPKVGPALRPIL